MKWPWRRRETNNGHAAAQAKAEAQRRLRETKRDWPKVHRAADEFAELMEQALRRRGT